MPSRQRAVAAGVHPGEVVEQGGKSSSEAPGGARTPRVVTCSSAYGGGRLGQTAVAVVLAVDAQRAEVRGQALDLAQEVGGGEAALAELAGQRVGGGGERHARVDQLAEQGGDEDGVARVVQLELVDAQQPVAAEGLHGLLEAERADEVGQLDEGAERLELGRGRGGVPQGGEQVGLADAVAAVEVDAARARRGPAGFLGRTSAACRRRPRAPPPRPAAKPLRTVTASVWLGWFGSGMYVSKRTESKRGGGTISATSRSAGTCGSRAHSDGGRRIGLSAAVRLGSGGGERTGKATQPSSLSRMRCRRPVSEACHTAAMRRLFPVSAHRTGPDAEHLGALDPRTASGRSTSWPTPTRTRRRTTRCARARRLAARQHGVLAGRRRPARRAARSRSPATPTCGSSGCCGRSRTRWWSARRPYGRRATGPARAREAFAAPPGRGRAGPGARDRRGQRRPGPGLLAAAVHRAAGAHPGADRRRGAPPDRVGRGASRRAPRW